MKRTFRGSIILFFKGVAMGAADVVPGVSGGTIAFISGIYEELLGSISSLNSRTLKLLVSGRIKVFWNSINGVFLVILLLGIAVSVASFAKLVSYLLENEPILLWSFFFGLVLASVFFVGKQITKWNLGTFFLLSIGASVGYYITILEPLIFEGNSYWFLFLSGALAICAMILPGISGSFILVLLGSYKLILDAIHNMNLKILFTVGVGAIFGLLSFSKILKWLFYNYKNLTLAMLTGFIIGSLNKIWPWKNILSWHENSSGEKIPLLQKNLSPFEFEGDNKFLFSIFFATVGCIVILILGRSKEIKSK